MSANRSARSCWTERFAAAVLGVVAVISPAALRAQPEAGAVKTSIKTPADWPERSELAEGIAKQLAKTVDFGGLKTTGGASAFVKIQTGVIYVSWLATDAASDSPEAAIRAALDQLRGATEGLGETDELDYAERRVGQALEAKRVWRHVANETITMSRVFLWKSPDSKLRLVRGECVYAEADAKTVAPICNEALATLSAEAIASGAVGELGAVAGPTPTSSEAPGGDAGPASSGPSMRAVDPDRPSKPGVLYQSDKKPEGRSNLWLFIVGGVLIVFAFWAMTRGRGDDEDDSEGDSEGSDASAGRASEEEE